MDVAGRNLACCKFFLCWKMKSITGNDTTQRSAWFFEGMAILQGVQAGCIKLCESCETCFGNGPVHRSMFKTDKLRLSFSVWGIQQFCRETALRSSRKTSHHHQQWKSYHVCHVCPGIGPIKGEVRAICRFWVFDGNGLLGHRLFDSRWFDKILQRKVVEHGVQKNAHVLVFRAEMLVTQYVLSSSRHLVTPWIYIHFCVWLGLFVDYWWLTEGWYAPDFLSTCSTCVPVAAPGITRSPSKRICRGTLSQKTWNWPTFKPVHVHERNRERRRSFDPAHALCRQLYSVGVLLREQDVLMLTFMVNLVALSPLSQRSTYQDAHIVPSSSVVDLALRCHAAKANSFAQVPSPKRKTKR